jgi:deoxyribonuclease-2
MLPILVSTHISSTAALSCLGPSGTAVDWWFMIKQPRWGDRSRSQCIGNCEGTAYAFVTSESPSSWQTGENITSTSSLLGVQLAGIYSGAVPNYVMYNDQLPNGTWTEVYGHSKGFFAYDATSAYFVQHSIPKFPNFVSGGYLYGSGQLYYGQHAFCMSVTPSALDEIASIMLWSYPVTALSVARGATRGASLPLAAPRCCLLTALSCAWPAHHSSSTTMPSPTRA